MTELPTPPADDFERELSAWLDGEPTVPADIDRRLLADTDLARALDRYRAVDRVLAALVDPPAERERQARLVEALIARRVVVVRGRRIALAAAVVAVAALVGFGVHTRLAMGALRGLATAPDGALRFAEPPGVRDLGLALATPRAARTPGWIRRLDLDLAARRELVERAIHDPIVREEALLWWAARSELLDRAELARRAVREPAAVALAERAVAAMAPSDAAELTGVIGRSAAATSELARLLDATARRRGVAFADELVELARRAKVLPAATAALDTIGPAAMDAVARRLDRDPHAWTILERSSQDHATDLLVRSAYGARGRWRAVRALEVRWTPELAPRVVALVADVDVGVALAARIAATDDGVALLAARFLKSGDAAVGDGPAVAIRALGRSPAPRATEELERVLARGDLAHLACAALVEQDLPRSADALARALAARRLGSATFEAALVDHPAPRAVAMFALACRDRARAREVTPALLAAADPRLLPVYRALLDHPARAEDALRAVARCESSAATDQLIAALDRPALKARAHRLLVRRTGLNLAPDPERWRASLGLEPARCG